MIGQVVVEIPIISSRNPGVFVQISEKSKCLIKQISRISGICGHRPAGLHASTAMRQDHATGTTGSQKTDKQITVKEHNQIITVQCVSNAFNFCCLSIEQLYLFSQQNAVYLHVFRLKCFRYTVLSVSEYTNRGILVEP